MWAIGVFEMRYQGRLYNLLTLLKYHIMPIIEKIEQEELEFNGRWCDDGGRAVE